MEYADFLEQVQERTRSSAADEAATAIQATLETLAACISFEESTDLASQLPDELADFLYRESESPPERLSLSDFVSRVADREGVEPAKAEEHTKAVLGVLAEAIEDDVAEVRSQLPKELRPLLHARSV